MDLLFTVLHCDVNATLLLEWSVKLYLSSVPLVPFTCVSSQDTSANIAARRSLRALGNISRIRCQAEVLLNQASEGSVSPSR